MFDRSDMFWYLRQQQFVFGSPLLSNNIRSPNILISKDFTAIRRGVFYPQIDTILLKFSPIL